MKFDLKVKPGDYVYYYNLDTHSSYKSRINNITITEHDIILNEDEYGTHICSYTFLDKGIMSGFNKVYFSTYDKLKEFEQNYCLSSEQILSAMNICKKTTDCYDCPYK